MKFKDPEYKLRWGEEILSLIKDIPSHSPAAAFIRHADRDPMPDIRTSDKVLLTKTGEEDAYQLGCCLPLHFTLHTYSSPVDRCRVTALKLAEGFKSAGGSGIYEGDIPDIYAPYVLDYEEVAHLANSMGNDFLRAWFNGSFPVTTIKAREEAAREQLEAVVKTILDSMPDHLSILVSHDWNIMLVLESFLGARYEDDGWLGYLDGSVVYLEDDMIRILWRRYVAALKLNSIIRK